MCVRTERGLEGNDVGLTEFSQNWGEEKGSIRDNSPGLNFSGTL